MHEHKTGSNGLLLCEFVLKVSMTEPIHIYVLRVFF